VPMVNMPTLSAPSGWTRKPRHESPPPPPGRSDGPPCGIPRGGGGIPGGMLPIPSMPSIS
jgi:hypothetical protein